MTDHAVDERSKLRDATRDYAIGLARAFGGAIVFALPLLMTMEMWQLGYTMDRSRLLVFLLANLLVLLGLAHFAGFERTSGLRDAAMDALAAYGVGVVAGTSLLALFGVIAPAMSTGEVIGKIAVQAVPASFGAVIARKQFGGGNDAEQDEKERRAGYAGQLFLMLAGALFMAFNVAPTDEIVLIALVMSPAHELFAIGTSILLLHAFVYSVGFSGQDKVSIGVGQNRALLRFTLPGYAVALAVSLFVLWVFGRTQEVWSIEVLSMVIVLGLPAAVGAAIARLLV